MSSESNIVAVLALVLAVASLGISVWQAILRWREFGQRQKARIAVDAGDVTRQDDHWHVELWLTNVGLSHARRVRVWLEDEGGAALCEPHPMPKPLMSGGESESIQLMVPVLGRSSVVARPVRKWRDSRDVCLPKDVSDQRITLE